MTEKFENDVGILYNVTNINVFQNPPIKDLKIYLLNHIMSQDWF